MSVELDSNEKKYNKPVFETKRISNIEYILHG